MTETITPDKVATTTTPADTFMEIRTMHGEGVLLYRPEDNSFISLTAEEWFAVRKEADDNQKAIDELQDANWEVTVKSVELMELKKQPFPEKNKLEQANQELDLALNKLNEKSEAVKKRVEAITDQKVDPEKLVELVPLTLMRTSTKKALKSPIYVKAGKLKSALAAGRVHLVQGETERKKAPAEKLHVNGKVNINEVHRRIMEKVQDKAQYKKEIWKFAPEDADSYSGILGEWAKGMGADATSFLERKQKEIIEDLGAGGMHNKDDPYRKIDLKPEAQFMRWSAGAGAEATFSAFQGNLHDKRDKKWLSRLKRGAKSAQFAVKANADASFAIGEAKVETIAYYPHAAGWHLYPTILEQPFDFGHFRLRGDLSLYAMAGASIAIEASLALMVVGDKQGVRGTPKGQKGVKARVGAKGEAQVFAGLKEGIDLAGAFQWMNPEGVLSLADPQKVDPRKAVAEYVDVANFSTGVAAIQGLQASAGFTCDYRGGQFVIAINAGLCLGLGGSGQIAGKVGVEQMKNFFMCLAHQLKQADYKKMSAVISQEAFEVFNKILYLVVVQKRKIEEFVGESAEVVRTLYKQTLKYVTQKGNEFLRNLESQLKSGWGWFAYMPPEARGALIASINDVVSNPQYAQDTESRRMAAYNVSELLATVQTTRQLENTLDRITVEMGTVPGRAHGETLILAMTDGTLYGNSLEQVTTQLAAASPIKGRPFMRNDEANFSIALFPLQHPVYLA